MGIFKRTAYGLFFASAMTAGQVTAADGSDEVVEETIVTAPRSMPVLQRQIERADVEMYKIFSALNDDPMYDVRCSVEKRYGSNLKDRVCKAGFELAVDRDVIEDERRLALRGETVFSGDYGLSKAELKKHQTELRRRMQQYASQNKALAQAIFKRAELQRDLKAAMQRENR